MKNVNGDSIQITTCVIKAVAQETCTGLRKAIISVVEKIVATTVYSGKL